MTTPLPHERDELVSAYLDGVAAPDEVASIESDPELAARVQELGSVVDRLGGQDAPSSESRAELRQAHLNAALSEYDKLLAAGEFANADKAEPAIESGHSITSLAEVRERRQPRRVNLVAAAAALVALMFAGAAIFGLSQGTTNDVVADASADAAGDLSVTFTQDDAADAATDAVEDAVTESGQSSARSSLEAAPAEVAIDGEQATSATTFDQAAKADELATDAEEAFSPSLESESAMDSDTAADTGMAADVDEAASDDDDAGNADDALALEPPLLGSVPSIEALDPKVQELFDIGSALAYSSSPVEYRSTCRSALAANPPGSSPVVLLAVAQVDGRPVEIFHTLVDDSVTAVVVAVGDCQVLGTITVGE